MLTNDKIRESTIKCLQKVCIPVHPHIPSINGALRRSEKEVAERIVALFAMLGIGREADPDMLWDWMDENEFVEFLSKEELVVMQKEKLLDEDLNICSWKQESLYALGWFVNFYKEMGFPDQECELESMFELIPPVVELQEMKECFKFRTNEELVEQLDFYYCIHAAIKHPELWENEGQRKNIKFAVVEERRRAFEWLISLDSNWDEITLDT